MAITLSPVSASRAQLRSDLGEFLADYARKALEEIDLSAALNSLVDIVRRDADVVAFGLVFQNDVLRPARILVPLHAVLADGDDVLFAIAIRPAWTCPSLSKKRASVAATMAWPVKKPPA